MNDERTANLLGALALALTDRMTEEAETRAEHGAAAPAALVSVGADPGLSVGALAQVIGITHSATVRLVDRLAGDGLMERRAGVDGRSVGLRLTRRGAARRRAILSSRRQVLSEALAALPEDGHAVLTPLIETLLAAMTKDRRQADHICRLCDEDVCPEATCPVECAALRAGAAS
ncbi:MAG: MarR family winged helix-turn-helix transcriptional regulator [Inquilinaceae bacterium]